MNLHSVLWEEEQTRPLSNTIDRPVKVLAPTSGGGDFLVDFSFRNLQTQKCFSHLFF
jgi:hypothetical protein